MIKQLKSLGIVLACVVALLVWMFWLQKLVGYLTFATGALIMSGAVVALAAVAVLHAIRKKG